MKKLIPLVLSSLIMACSPTLQAPLRPSFGPGLRAPIRAPLRAQSSTANTQVDPATLLKLVERIYKQNYADDLDNLKKLEELTRDLERQGVSIYNVVSANPQVREQLYPLSE